jgi:undecaprenyl-diphosphatase
MNSFAQAALFSLLYRRLAVWIAAFCIAALVAFSRIYVGAHWPLDVFAGAVLGAAVGCFVFGAYALVRARWKHSPKPAAAVAAV